MGITDNDKGGTGGSTGGRGNRKNGGVWVGLVVERDRSVGSVIASVVVHIVGF